LSAIAAVLKNGLQKFHCHFAGTGGSAPPSKSSTDKRNVAGALLRTTKKERKS
jgi:hypothetical protein